jgi:predicted SAM-dependent methyltransferase
MVSHGKQNNGDLATMKELLLGCGSRTEKDIYIDNPNFENVTRLDYNADHNPDILHDLTVHPLPFDDEEFDEIHAYEVLEHLATQGDYEFFFQEFSEYWRILKPQGRFYASVPIKEWTWGDPSHRRAIQPETLIFLDQDQYVQVGETSMSDFRNIYKASFKTIYAEARDKFYFVLEKE